MKGFVYNNETRQEYEYILYNMKKTFIERQRERKYCFMVELLEQ